METQQPFSMKKQLLFFGILFSAVLAKAEARITSEQYIDQWKITAIEQMNEHGVPASITLAQGILESGSGNSALAKNANNHFGIKCHKSWDGATFYQDDDEEDECFRSYDNASLSYHDHSVFLTGRERYSALFDLKITDYKGWAKGLKKAGYATNPRYADLLINIVEKYELAQYDLMPYLPIEVKKQQEKEELSSKPEKDSPVTEIKEDDHSEMEVFVSTGHSVELNKNRTRYIVVKEGDTFYKISKEFNIALWQLYKYNELGKRDVLTVGEVIYLDPKRSRAKRGSNVYVCPQEMTLREVSQAEGIKLKKLMKYNFIENPDAVLNSGTKVILR